ncbi:MAG: glutamine amidotransferase [Planctomycetota bacterium]
MTLPLAVQEVVESQSGTSETLRLLDAPAPWIIVLVVLPLFALVTWLGYGRESISTSARAVLSTLRFAALTLLFLVLTRPVLVQQREEVYPAEVVVLVDDSASMRRKDSYSGDADARAALSSLAAGGLGDTTRLALVQGALSGGFLGELEAGGYKTSLYGFDEGATAWTSPDQGAGRGPGTHLGDALTQVLATQRGRYVTDVVVLSDGRQNGGLPLLEAGRAAGAAGIPVHTVVVGDTRPERNALVELVEAPRTTLEGDEIAVAVRVLGRGTEDVAAAQVLLEELDPRDPTASPRLLAEEEVALTPSGERVVLVAPPEGLPGERRFRVSVPTLPGETMVDDNQVELSVHVSTALLRVLYVDGYPRWEYRYLKNLLLRSDKKIQAQCYLLSATPDFPQEASGDLEPLRRVPTTRDELLDNYDVVILGDVNPYKISLDPTEGEQFLTALREFVEAGGGLLFQAGEYDNPRAYSQTPLEDVLPVVLDSTNMLAFEGDTRFEFHPALEDPTNPHEVVRLHPDTETNRTLWEGPSGLRGFFWYRPVERAKPGAEVLARHPSLGNNHGRHPLVVVGYFPSGRTMYLGVDSTWMWRYHFGDRYHERFWRNAIRWLALGRLKSGDRRYRLETPRTSYHLDERVTLEARVLDEDFRPAEKPSQDVLWSGPEGRTVPLRLLAVPDRAGLYRAALQVDRPGLYRAWIEAGGERVATVEFDVTLPSRETANPAPDPEALQGLAATTGGRAVSLAELDALSEEFPGDEERREPISSRLDDAWDHWGTLLLALGLLSLEWILRKRVELV